jgi:alpha-D-ribose 1-methylphosphonate 5-triphosphate synthase subunit PhnL
MLQNTFTVSGTIKAFTDKSIKTNDYGTQIIGWVSQRDVPRMSNGDAVGSPKYVVGVGIKATDPEVIETLVALDKARQGKPETTPVTLTGRLTQWVAKSKTGGADEFRYQLEVHAVEVL